MDAMARRINRQVLFELRRVAQGATAANPFRRRVAGDLPCAHNVQDEAQQRKVGVGDAHYQPTTFVAMFPTESHRSLAVNQSGDISRIGG